MVFLCRRLRRGCLDARRTRKTRDDTGTFAISRRPHHESSIGLRATRIDRTRLQQQEKTMLNDRYGNLMSTSSKPAVAKFDRACEMIRLYHGDPIAALDDVLNDDPDCAMAWAARAGILVQQADKAYLQEAERSIRAGAAANGNERERAHLSAARHWLEGRIHDATIAYARIAQENPRDLIALQTAHIGCFYLGRQSELRDWPLQALRAFGRGDDGHHAVLGMFRSEHG
jgi:hypothetical protein